MNYVNLHLHADCAPKIFMFESKGKSKKADWSYLHLEARPTKQKKSHSCSVLCLIQKEVQQTS